MLNEDLTTDNITAKLMLREAYETAYGIYNHDAPDAEVHPWALIAHGDKEDYGKLGPHQAIARVFMLNDIGKKFNISFLEFVALPREMVNCLIELTEEELKVEAKAAAEIKGKLDNKR